MHELPLLEISVLSYLMKNPHELNDIQNNFVSQIAKDIYKIICDVYNKDQTIEISNLFIYGKKINDGITKEKLQDIFDTDVNSTAVKDYVEELKQYKIQEELRVQFGGDLIKALDGKSSPDILKVKELLNQANDLISLLDSEKRIEINTGEQWFNEYSDVIKERAKGKSFYSTGDMYIDQFFPMGLAPGYMTTIFGNAGTGKSTVGLHLFNCEINLGIPTVYALLEMGKIATMDRLIAKRTKISYDFFMHNDYDSDKEDYILSLVNAERKKLAHNNQFRIIEGDSLSLNDLDEQIPKLKKMMHTDYFVIHLDLTTMLSDFNAKGASQASVYEQAGNRLHQILKKHQIHAINYVQGKRDDETIKIKSMSDLRKFKPRLNNIKNSAIFEERSRVVLGIFRPRYYAERYLRNDPMLEMLEDIMEISFLKQTMGQLPELRYYFKGETSSIMPYIVDNPEDDIYEQILNETWVEENNIE